MRLGRPILAKMFSEDRVAYVDRLFERYGVWAILIAAFTPVPYKVFAIAAGVWRMDRRKFIIASAIGRGARFGTIGVLVFLFGEEIEAFLTENFELLTVGVSVVAVALGAGWYILHRPVDGCSLDNSPRPSVTCTEIHRLNQRTKIPSPVVGD